MSRAHLPNRRPGESFNVLHNGAQFIVTIGQYEDGKPGEVFVSATGNAGKGSDIEALARDAAILMSLGIQYGVPLATMRAAVTRGESGEPATLVGAVLDAVA